MQGLHLTGDLFDCARSAGTLTDSTTLSRLCREASIDAVLTIVDEKYRVFPEWEAKPGGSTGAVLLAESHLAIHTWPERRGVVPDVYVRNFTADNSARARQSFDALLPAFRPNGQVVNHIRRGDLAAADAATAVRADAPDVKESADAAKAGKDGGSSTGSTPTPAMALPCASGWRKSSRPISGWRCTTPSSSGDCSVWTAG